jgi:DnaJ domain
MLAWLLQSLFPALLPPADGSNNKDDQNDNGSSYEYYATLGLPKYSSVEKVRTAYKKLSLRLHPDKQPGPIAAALYEKVQEANNVLKDDTKRKLYHELKCSVARYEFLERGHLFHPSLIHENLLRASWFDKTRLLLLTLFLIGLLLLQPILVAVKVNHTSSSSSSSFLHNAHWMSIGIPLFLLQTIHSLVQWVVVYYDIRNTSNVLSALESSAWLAATLLLSYQFQYDRRWSSSSLPWGYISIPFFVAIGLRLLSYGSTLRDIRTAQNSMVTEEYLRQVIRPNRNENGNNNSNNNSNNNTKEDGEDNNDNEDDDDDDDDEYIIVQPDDQVVVVTLGLLERPPDREELEMLRVQTSDEYREAQAAVDGVHRLLVTWMLTYLPFAILCTLQLTKIIDTNWWIIFIPLWLRLFIKLTGNFFLCCCLVSPADLILHEQTTMEAAAHHHQNVNGGTASPSEPPTGRYFANPESEMSAFADWGGADTLTSERIDQVRQDKMGIVAVPEEKDIDEAATVGGQELGTGLVQPTATGEPASSSSSGTAGTTAASTNGLGRPTAGAQHGGGDGEEEYVPSPPPHGHTMEESIDEEYLQARMQACTLFCTAGLELIVLCLMVGLVQTPGAYNALWVLFPFFFIAAIILIVAGCCIYARELPAVVPDGGMATAAAMRDNNEGNNVDDDDEEKQQQNQQSVVVAKGGEEEQRHQSSEATAATAQKTVASQEANDDKKDLTSHRSEMDDLD